MDPSQGSIFLNIRPQHPFRTGSLENNKPVVLEAKESFSFFLDPAVVGNRLHVSCQDFTKILMFAINYTHVDVGFGGPSYLLFLQVYASIEDHQTHIFSGSKIFVDDGLLSFTVARVTPSEIECIVDHTGTTLDQV